ncbi:MAG TPA: hypothetical protein VFR12_07315 [Pyrinomonadaceae bacterium]|nr:hypothetical protein [Pyrinomonadaceae bacterium]
MSGVKYPNVTVRLTGENGNAFNLIGLTTSAIRKVEGNDAANKFVNEAMLQTSYDNLLVYIQEIVNVL